MKIIPFRPVLLAASIAAALSLLVTTAYAQPPANVRSYGEGNPFQVSDLPTSQFRSQLEALSPQARTKAMGRLNGLHFHTHDIPFLRADKDGGIFYADGFSADGSTGKTATVTSTQPVASSTTAVDTFKLHSKPGSSKVIYLDFDGHTISGTAWNSSAATLTAVPYDLDGSPASFSSAELANIAEIWRRVAEDYIPFDVDVTTELPASFGPTVGRILVTKDTDANGQAMPAQGAGGVAYVNVFGMSNYASYYSPALVYYNRLGNGEPDYVAEAASHEMGHNMGLSHDGTSTLGYYGGQSTGGNISWGPIMGTGYYRNVSQWSKGEYPDANNFEDDVAIITGKVKARPDDHADQTSAATPLVIDAAGNVSATILVDDPNNLNTANKGIIGSRTDVDVFSFSTSGGAVALQATPAREPRYTRGGDLDINLSLYDRSGALVASNDPVDDTGAAINVNLPAGQYYLAVDGVGSTYSSDYASLGQYSITGNVPQGSDTNPPTPNPMGWAAAPAAVDYQSIKMTAVTAQDDMSSVSYYFACTAGGNGCKDSGWISTPTYTASGLDASTAYTFTVKARDVAGNETTSSASASATTQAVPVVNQAPVANADSATVTTGGTVTIPVLANDTDPDGDTLTITAVSNVSKGTAAISGAQVIYKAGSRTGSGSFTYTISDGNGHTAKATVSVSITSGGKKR